jgi:Ca2+/Na+ antiporter
MEKQNYQNHSTIHSPRTRSQNVYYISVIGLTLLAIANVCRSIIANSGRLYALLFFLTGIALLACYFLFRSFALKAQDRAIRAEENLRHFAMTGKLLDKNLKLAQIIALRFASDEEYLGLADKALKQNLSNTDIKKAIQNWKEDHHRA